VVAVRLVVAARPATLGACELCAVGPARLTEAVLIEHADGAVVALSACDRCGRAARRIAAAVGPGASTIGGETVGRARRAAPGPRRTRPVRALRAPGPRRPRVIRSAPELIRERGDQVVDADGTQYAVRVYGRPRRDGTWVGWIAFAATAPQFSLETDAETSQPDRAALAYWADGLQPTYLEGAFARAHRRAGGASAG
jgi:hypothetical protein